MIKVYRTFEIDDNLWRQITIGFNESFDLDIDEKSLRTGFCTSNPLGYAFHAVAFSDNGDVMGYNTFTPTFYKNDIKILVSGSSFVRKKYRKDIFIFYDMVIALREIGEKEGFHVTVGVPNKNSREYALKILKNKHIADLDYYILPFNISKCIKKPFLKPLDFFNRVYAMTHIAVQNIWTKCFNQAEKDVKYTLITDEKGLEVRFKSSIYKRYKDGVFSAYYRIVLENKANAVYLMDFRENGKRTRLSLCKAVKFIFKQEKPDIILFVGFLHLPQSVLFKVPRKLVPKPLPMTCYILDKTNEQRFSDMSNANNWNFSLMNFDAR